MRLCNRIRPLWSKVYIMRIEVAQQFQNDCSVLRSQAPSVLSNLWERDLPHSELDSILYPSYPTLLLCAERCRVPYNTANSMTADDSRTSSRSKLPPSEEAGLASRWRSRLARWRDGSIVPFQRRPPGQIRGWWFVVKLFKRRKTLEWDLSDNPRSDSLRGRGTNWWSPNLRQRTWQQ